MEEQKQKILEMMKRDCGRAREITTSMLRAWEDKWEIELKQYNEEKPNKKNR